MQVRLDEAHEESIFEFVTNLVLSISFGDKSAKPERLVNVRFGCGFKGAKTAEPFIGKLRVPIPVRSWDELSPISCWRQETRMDAWLDVLPGFSTVSIFGHSGSLNEWTWTYKFHGGI